MKHTSGDERERRSSRQQTNQSSTVVFVTADELERRRTFAAEIDRIQRRLGPVELSAVELIDYPVYDIDPNEFSFTRDEHERRKALAEEADRMRAAFGPLGFSAVDLIREARDGSDAALY